RTCRYNWHDDTIWCISACIVYEVVTYSQQDTLIIKSILYLVQLATFLVSCDKVFASILDPLNRSAQVNGSKRRQNLLGIEHHDLCAETTSHIRRYYTNFVLRQVKDCCKTIADRNRALSRYPAGKHFFMCIPTCQNTPTLH